MGAPSTVWVLTTSRADFGIYRSVLSALDSHPALTPELIVTGMHMSARHGVSLPAVEQSGYDIAGRFSCLEEDDDSPHAVAHSMARATEGLANVLQTRCPDLLLTLGDRFEMLSAALAAIPFRVPVAHIHGGEETEGAIDNVFRHMLTKMAHLHFPATPTAARRIRQMGEPAAHIVTSGAPALDSISATPNLTADEFETRFGFPLDEPFLMVTYHPVTLQTDTSMRELKALLSVLQERPERIVFSGTNADTGGIEVQANIDRFAARHSNIVQIESFGATAYYTAMRHAQAMLGNSSSGIIEAASAGLPVVNIGDRQAGRERSANIVDTYGRIENIRAALTEALSRRGTDFRNVYGDGKAGTVIADAIAAYLSDSPTAGKAFADIGVFA
ncbi:UDP-N-acetylglucosamine 2-epimerase [uncultured Algimonas sp.]|uniref:UDP-N-acetylglucosamine 2-epimerase n=1 Tax=uncultured Algimonas sp. TaxID=1547920 RepID=UPI002601C530|nr:UDP-N-acetylglucosamine 2-epimerase [uncultured Algimonas sp.]